MAERGKVMTADDIKDIIRNNYEDGLGEWIVLFELRTSTGYTPARYIDAMAFNCWPSKKYLRIAFEIKTTKADFLNELKDPGKRFLAEIYSNLFYFVAPKGVLDWRNIPVGCGLIEIKDHKLRVELKPRLREASPLPDSFIVSALRKARYTRWL